MLWNLIAVLESLSSPSSSPEVHPVSLMEKIMFHNVRNIYGLLWSRQVQQLFDYGGGSVSCIENPLSVQINLYVSVPSEARRNIRPDCYY